MTTQMRSETALVRPFAGIDAADAPLNSVRLIVGDDDEHEPGPVILPSSVLSEAEFRVAVPSRAEVWQSVEGTVVPTVDCALAIILTAHTHRVSAVAFRSGISGADWPEDIVLPRANYDLILNDLGGFNITVAIVLTHDLSPSPLQPSMAGTWLAKREFKVGPEYDDTAFSPEELSDEVREYYKLPTGVLRYIEVDGVLDCETISEAVTVYVDPESLHLLLANPNDSASIQIQVELAVQTTEAVLVQIARELDSPENALTAAALESHEAAHSFCSKVGARLNISIGEILDLASGNSARLRALLEAAFELRAVTAASLKEK